MVQANLELGNQIWFDADKDGMYDVGVETPAPAGVVVQLFNATTDTLLATTTTNALGQYLFSGLVAGDYYLVLPKSNFLAGHPLAGFKATSGPGVSHVPDDGHDLDSNGDNAAMGVRTAMVTLYAKLPILEVDPWITVNDDRLSNLTIDFGLVQLDTLAFTGANVAIPSIVALWLLLVGVLLLLIRPLRRYLAQRRIGVRTPSHRS
jgi:hypothetical protein